MDFIILSFTSAHMLMNAAVNMNNQRKSPTLHLILTAFICSLSLDKPTEAAEYCLTESFEAKCSEGEVILMEKALFGRMALGRCATRNYGYLGCSADALPRLDSVCSGRRSCELSVSDPSLVRTKPCPGDFTSYLEASHSCVKVLDLDMNECSPGKHHNILDTSGYITGPPLLDTNGASNCLLTFNLLPGQRLGMTFYDLDACPPPGQGPGHPGGLSGAILGSECIEVDRRTHRGCFRMMEPTAGSNASTFCSGGMQRERRVVSSTNVVHLQLLGSMRMSQNRLQQNVKYVIKFEVVGCRETLRAPHGAHVRYGIEHAVVVCNQSGASYMVTCKEGAWHGEMKNCSEIDEGLKMGNVVVSQRSDFFNLPPLGLSILIILGVAFVVIVYIAVTIIFTLYIRRRRNQRKHSFELHSLGSKSLGSRSGGDQDLPASPREASGSSHPPFYSSPAPSCSFNREECMPMLDPPSLVLDSTFRTRYPGSMITIHECPACTELSNQVEEARNAGQMYVCRSGASVSRSASARTANRECLDEFRRVYAPAAVSTPPGQEFLQGQGSTDSWRRNRYNRASMPKASSLRWKKRQREKVPLH